MAYGDGLENRCRCKTTVGSNPTPSATPSPENSPHHHPLVRLNRDSVEHGKAHRIKVITLNIRFDQNIILPEP